MSSQATHSQALGDRLVALAEAMKKDKVAIASSTMVFLMTLTTEQRIKTERVANPLLQAFSRSGLGTNTSPETVKKPGGAKEVGGAATAEKSGGGGGMGKVVLSRGIMSGGCIIQ